MILLKRPFGRHNCFGEQIRMVFQTEVAQQLPGADAPVRLPTEKREGPSRADNRVQQPACSNSVTELQAVGHDPFNTEVLSQWPHNVVQTLANQDDLPMLRHPFTQLGQTFRPELVLQYVLEILFAKEIQ